jgi:hypothetical protein
MSVRKLLLATLVAGAVSVNVHAQVSRVFVSVTGNDANVCSDIATPCRTFAGGITQVDPQGEVIVIASGSYAGGTITKSVKINVASGVVAFSGLPITVNPGAGGTVVIRGLTLKAATAGSGTGVTHQTGTLFVENTVVDGWQDGLKADSGAEKLFVKGSVFRNNSQTGLWLDGGGTTVFALDRSFFENNTLNGLLIGGALGRVSNSVLTRNGMGADVNGAGAATAATFQRCEVSSNTGQGLSARGGATLRVSESTIVRNAFGLENQLDSSTVESFGNNVIRGNLGGNNIVGTVATVSLQ